MWDLAPMNIYINYSLYVNYSSILNMGRGCYSYLFVINPK
jgi:hypothetical protein